MVKQEKTTYHYISTGLEQYQKNKSRIKGRENLQNSSNHLNISQVRSTNLLDSRHSEGMTVHQTKLVKNFFSFLLKHMDFTSLQWMMVILNLHVLT